jgi:fucose 4-O-acetylase-like acetyltransferase
MAIPVNGISMKSHPASADRDLSVDFVKGMLMWCVIYGHSIDALCGGLSHSPVWLHSFVRTFDLPLFMVISGFFLRRGIERKSLSIVVLDRITMLFVPIAAWTLLRGHLNVFSGMYYFLWAVLVSSLICVAARCAVSFCDGKVSKILELSLLIVAAFSLYIVKIPWNLFYLFPFFVFGYCLRNLKFECSKRMFFFVAFVFAVGLCFWSFEWTPWQLGAFAWKTNAWACLIYVYRTVLALAGIVIMSNVFRVIMSYSEDMPLFRRVLVDGGKETLAIYILQAIVVERLLRNGCKIIIEQLNITFPNWYMNLVGYIMAPIVSFIMLWVLLMLAQLIKRIPIVRYSFGFKFATVS